MKKLSYLIIFMAIFIALNGYSQNNALHFDGTNDYVQIPSFESSITQGTFSFWIKLDATPGNNARIMSESWNDDEIIFNSGTTVITTTSTFISGDNLISSPIGTDVWTHVAISADGTDSELYINGKLVDTGGPSGFSLGSVCIGGKYTALWEVVPGQIDEFQIWSDVRTESEIREFMYKELSGSEEGLFAYYKFNEASGTTASDASGNNNNGSLENMTGNEWVTSSAFFGPKKAFHFNTNDYVSISSIFGLGTTSVTLECWVNLNSTSRKGAFIHIGNHDSGYGIGVGNGYWDSNGNEICVLFDQKRWISTGVNIGTGWHHIVLVLDNNSDPIIYLDGEEVYSDTGQTDPSSPLSNSSIGSSQGGTRNLTDGIIDEVRIWNEVRSATEIQENMCRTLLGNEANLVAYYNLDGTAVIDYTSNQNDGTIGGDGDESVASTAFNSWLNTTSTSWSTTSNWSLGSEPTDSDNVGIDSQNTNPIVTNTADCNIFYLGSGASLTVSDGASFWPRENQFINSNASFTFQKNIAESGKWHMISSPNNNSTASVFNGYFLQGWSEDTSGWYEISESGELLIPVKGYSFFDTPASKTSFSFIGAPNFGEQTISITYHDTEGITDGMNLIGNPYPSSIDWSYLDGENYGAVYTWDPSLNEYRQWNNNDGNGSQYIAPGQGFFVYTASNKTFTINNDCRTHNGADNFYKNLDNKIENGLILSTNNRSQIFIRFDDDSSEDFDFALDAFKLFSNGDGQSELYTKHYNTKLAIDCRPETDIIQLGYQNNQYGTHTIELQDSDGITAEIEDTKLNQFHDLTKGPYSFDWEIIDSEERFILHLKATGTDELEEQDIQVYTANGQLYVRINHNNQFDQMLIYDLAGRTINEYHLQNQNLQNFDLSHLSGAYLIHLKGTNNSITKKIIMK